MRIRLVWGVTIVLGVNTSLFGACANELNMGGKRVTNVGAPIEDNDATRKVYVDRGGAALSETTVTHNGLSYGIIYVGGKAWLDRNLGATKVADSLTDTAAYGDLYQWGRLTDGHEKRGSGTTETLANALIPGHPNFIKSVAEPYHWLDTTLGAYFEQRAGIFWSAIGAGGVTNGVCPNGWRVPTEQDFIDLYITDTNDAFQKLKLTLAGARYSENGTIDQLGTGGHYWTSTSNQQRTRSFSLYRNNTNHVPSYDTDGTNFVSALRGHGLSVRCVKYLGS